MIVDKLLVRSNEVAMLYMVARKSVASGRVTNTKLSEDTSFIDALKSSVYHHPAKKCQLAYFGFRRKVKIQQWSKAQQRYKYVVVTVYIKKAKCRTHNAMLCYAEGQCFWQQGTHYGSLSKGYKSLN